MKVKLIKFIFISLIVIFNYSALAGELNNDNNLINQCHVVVLSTSNKEIKLYKKEKASAKSQINLTYRVTCPDASEHNILLSDRIDSSKANTIVASQNQNVLLTLIPNNSAYINQNGYFIRVNSKVSVIKAAFNVSLKNNQLKNKGTEFAVSPSITYVNNNNIHFLVMYPIRFYP